MTDIFISYSRRDKVFVQKLYESLREQGRDIWVDWEDIPPTADWRKEIYDGIEKANTFLFVISPESVRSEVCGEELKHAIDNNKQFVPLLYQEIIEEGDKKRVHPAISSHNWLFFRDQDDFDKSLKILSDAIDTDLNHVREHTRLLVRARQWESKGRSNGFLLSGAELREAEVWLTQAVSKDPEPTKLHSEYIFASRRAATRRQQLLVTASLIAAGISLMLAVIAFIFYQRAETERSRAERQAEISDSLALAANSQLQLNNGNNDLAIALGLEANTINDPPLESQAILEDAAYAPGTRLVLQGHNGGIDGVRSAVFSSDGQQVLSGSCSGERNDSGRCIRGEMILWNAATGEIIQRFQEHIGLVQEVAFMPGDDQRGFSSSCGERDDSGSCVLGEVIQWDLATGDVLQRYTAENNGIRSFAVSPDGRLLAGGSFNGQVVVWNVESGEQLFMLGADGSGHSTTVNDIAFSSDSSQLVTGAADQAFMVWNAETGELVQQVLTEYQVLSVGFYAGDSMVITSSSGFTIDFWSVSPGEMIAFNEESGEPVISRPLMTLRGHLQRVNSIALDQSGLFLLSGSDDSTMRLWNLLTGEEVQRFTGHSGVLSSVAFSPDGRRAVSASVDGTLRVWDMFNGAMAQRLDGHQNTVFAVAFSPDGSTLYSAGADETIRVWNAANSGEISQIPVSETISAFELSPDGTQILTGDAEGLKLLNAETGEVVNSFEDYQNWVQSVAFSTDGTHAISGSQDGEVVYWDLTTGEQVYDWSLHNGQNVTSVDISTDGTRAVSSAVDRQTWLYNLETGEQIGQINSTGELAAPVSFSPVGDRLLAVLNNTIVLWTLDGQEVQRFEGHSEQVNSVVFNQDGGLILSGSGDGTLRLWDVASGNEVHRINYGAAVIGVTLNADGALAMTGSGDFSARVWDIVPPTLSDMQTWIGANRYVPDFTCLQGLQYRMDVEGCDVPAASDEAAS